jgi:hypothetical protein
MNATRKQISKKGGYRNAGPLFCFVPDRCRVSAEALTKKTLGHIDQELPLDPTPEEINKAREKIAPYNRFDSVAALGAGYFCAKCPAYCPVGGEDWLKTVSSQQMY